jgi:hypothetical protein
MLALPRAARTAFACCVFACVVQSCGAAGGDTVRAPTVDVRVVVSPTPLRPDESATVAITATPEAGDRVTSVVMTLSGATTSTDSIPVTSDGGVSLTRYPGRFTDAVALSLDGAYAFFPTANGIVKVRTSTNVVEETFALGHRPTQVRLLADGFTLVALAAGQIDVIDIW